MMAEQATGSITVKQQDQQWHEGVKAFIGVVQSTNSCRVSIEIITSLIDYIYSSKHDLFNRCGCQQKAAFLK